MGLKSWLQLFRAQTAPATVLLVLVPFLAGNPISGTVVVLAVYALLVHYFSFGENSLMDTVMGYDREDPGKRHHPLISGAISLPLSHNVIHWGLIILTAIGVAITYLVSPNPLPAMTALVMWVALGHGYNEGLSKESLFGFISISLCFTSMAAWAWFLGHGELTPLGELYIIYVFFVILFQISYSGHLKEIGQSERSNILVKMGAKLIPRPGFEAHFSPGLSFVYGMVIKFASIVVLDLILLLNYSLDKLIWITPITISIAWVLLTLTLPRSYNRPKELLNMSVMEILSIYAPIPLLLPWTYSIILMVAGVVYFFGINRWLWGVSYPKV